jgi:hypothetical protein
LADLHALGEYLLEVEKGLDAADEADESGT